MDKMLTLSLWDGQCDVVPASITILSIHGKIFIKRDRNRGGEVNDSN